MKFRRPSAACGEERIVDYRGGLSLMVRNVIVAIAFCCCFIADAGSPWRTFQCVTTAAAEERRGRSPYGGGRPGAYGEKRRVSSAAEARKTLKGYVSGQERLGAVREKELYYEADVLKRNRDEVIDTLILDKRTGRIRSKY